jgi:hypothetical protein
MGFSSQQYHNDKQERRWRIHPAWRGIGCILFLLVPIMAWVGTSMVLQNSQRIPLSYQLTKLVVIPYSHIRVIDQVIIPVNHYFQQTGFMFGQLYLTIIFSVVGFGVLAFLYAILYRMAGPPRYGPFDVPPGSVKR